VTSTEPDHFCHLRPEHSPGHPHDTRPIYIGDAETAASNSRFTPVPQPGPRANQQHRLWRRQRKSDRDAHPAAGQVVRRKSPYRQLRQRNRQQRLRPHRGREQAPANNTPPTISAISDRAPPRTPPRHPSIHNWRRRNCASNSRFTRVPQTRPSYNQQHCLRRQQQQSDRDAQARGWTGVTRTSPLRSVTAVQRQRAFVLTVAASRPLPNTPPTISTIADLTISQNAGLQSSASRLATRRRLPGV